MAHIGRKFLPSLPLTLLLCVCLHAQTQTATYHLHKEASTTTGLFQLKAAGPDGTSLAVQTANLKNVAAGAYLIKAFDTPAGVPNDAGIIPAGSIVTFSLYMKKTASSGTIYPQARVNVNGDAGALVASVTGSTALTTTLTKYTLTAVAASNVSLTTSDRFYVWVGVNVSAAPTTNTNAELDVEGTLGGNYDSQVVVPLPNSAPTVNITSPAGGAVYAAPAAITISASAADADGSVTKVEFFEGSTKLGEDTTSPYTYAWNGVAASSYAYTLTAKATDNEGLSTTSAPVSVSVAGAGTLGGVFATPQTPASVNLTAEGTADWAHWGMGSPAAFDHKRGVTQQISNFSRVGATDNSWLNDNPTTFSWTDGTPSTSAANTPTGVFVSGDVGNGFDLYVPADTNLRTLKLYVGLWYAQAKMDVTLSDGSAPAFIDTSFGGTGGVMNAVYTINFKAASAGQTLRVRYTINNNLYYPYGNISLIAATLSGGGNFGGLLSSDFAMPATPASVNLTDEGTSDWAHWGMGSPTAFDRKKDVEQLIGNFTKIGTSSVSWLNDNPTKFSWADGTPTFGATDTPTGVFINGVGGGFEFTVPADIKTRTLKLYLGLWKAQGKLEASVSDGSAPPLVDTALGNTGGTSNAVYTINFKAASAGQTLKVRYTLLNDYFAPYGNITLEAATLSGGAPTIEALTPAAGPVGAEVVIEGKNFGSVPGAVSFNGVAASPTSWGNLRITVPVPEGATTGPVVVTAGESASDGAPFTVTPPESAGGVTYVYDELGRVIAVIDPAGESARYTYDALGNLVSVTRQSSAAVTVALFTPDSSPVGAPVTIHGTGFSTNTLLDTVKFNGVTAVVRSASNTQLVANVPAGATTGPISVTTPNGTGTSATAFTVSANGLPSISGFTPAIGGYGTPVAVSGSNFENVPYYNDVKFNGFPAEATASTATSLSTSVPFGTGSGRITVATRAGMATSPADFFVVPQPYAAADVETTGRMFVGQSKTVTITTANKVAMVLFDGSAGQRVSLDVTNNTSGTCKVYLYSPRNGLIATTVSNGFGTFIESAALSETGTYTLLVDPDGAATPTLTLNLYDIPPDVAGSITPGGQTVTVTTVPGQNARLTFEGTAGRRISLKVGTVSPPTSGPSSWCRLTVLSPNGSALVQLDNVAGGEVILDRTLTATGTHTIVVDPYYNKKGSLPLTLYDVVDVTGTMAPNGSPVTAVTTVPGQNVEYTFQGTAGQRVALYMNAYLPSMQVGIRKPDGTFLAPYAAVYFIDTTTLPVTGTYTVSVNPAGAETGTTTMTLYDVPPDVTGSLTPGGPAVTVSIPSPGQNASLTFSGTAGQRLSLQASGVTLSSCTITIKNPAGVAIAPQSYVSTSGGIIDLPNLPAAGVYTVFVDPPIIQTGSLTLALLNVTDVAASITPGGAAVTVTTTSAGQNAVLTFNGAAGQKVSLKLSGVTIPSSYVSIRNPDGTDLYSPTNVTTSGGFIDTLTLPVAGAYTILVNPADANTGSMTLTLYNVVDVTASTTVNARGIKLTTTVPGQNAALTFPGTAGQLITVKVSGSTMGNVAVYLRQPNGATLAYVIDTNTSFNLPQVSLPTTDTYTIYVDPYFTANVGSITITVASP